METLNIIDDSGDEYIEHAEFEDVTGVPQQETELQNPFVFKVATIDASYFQKQRDNGDGVGEGQSYRTGSLLSTLMDYLNSNEISIDEDPNGSRGPQVEDTGAEYDQKEADFIRALHRIRWNN